MKIKRRFRKLKWDFIFLKSHFNKLVLDFTQHSLIYVVTGNEKNWYFQPYKIENNKEITFVLNCYCIIKINIFYKNTILHHYICIQNLHYVYD